MHPKEARKEKLGTGKISHLFLQNSKLLVGIDFTASIEVNALINDPNNDCFVLYPGPQSLNISDPEFYSHIGHKKTAKTFIVFLIDGTWPCAKKMMRLSKNLNTLPRLTFSPTTASIFEIKQQPAKFCLSTLEAIHLFLKKLNAQGFELTFNHEDQMLAVFKLMINYQLECARNPTLAKHQNSGRGYTKSTERQTAKKWSMRNVVLAQ
jgi:DTW domain-containing protein YfiP